MKRIQLFCFALIICGGSIFATGEQEETNAVNSESLSELKGELVVYSTIFAEYAEAMKIGFETIHPGVTVHVINPGGTEAMMKKLDAEKSNPQADVVHSGSSLNYEFAIAQDLIQPFKPVVAGFEPSIAVGSSELTLSHPEDYYHVWSLMFSGIMYNSVVMEKNGLPLPVSYADLQNPLYEGHIISANPLKSSTAGTNVMATISSYGDKAWDLWDGIDKNIPYYSNSSSKIYALTNKGEFAMAICLSRPVFVAKLEGYPVDFIFPEDGSQVADNAMALVKGSKNPEIAKKFIEYILSDEMQKLGASYLYIPVKKGVVDPSESSSLESVLSKVKSIVLPNAELADASKEKIQEVFGNVTRNKAQ